MPVQVEILKNTQGHCMWALHDMSRASLLGEPAQRFAEQARPRNTGKMPATQSRSKLARTCPEEPPADTGERYDFCGDLCAPGGGRANESRETKPICGWRELTLRSLQEMDYVTECGLRASVERSQFRAGGGGGRAAQNKAKRPMAECPATSRRCRGFAVASELPGREFARKNKAKLRDCGRCSAKPLPRAKQS
jgi:hypothetical protein